jgi:hypothetical protein
MKYILNVLKSLTKLFQLKHLQNVCNKWIISPPFHTLIIIIMIIGTIIRGAAKFPPLLVPVVTNNLEHSSSNLLIVPPPCICSAPVLGCRYDYITTRGEVSNRTWWIMPESPDTMLHNYNIWRRGVGWGVNEAVLRPTSKGRMGAQTVRHIAYVTVKLNNRC